MKKDNVNKKKILIVGSSKLPIPAVKGGAVPNLIEEILIANEEKRKIDITCISCFDKEAFEVSYKYNYTKFSWIKFPKLIKNIDKFIYFISNKILHISRLLSLSYFFQVLWMTICVALHLKKNNYDYVVFENSIPILFSLKLFNNSKKYKDKYYFHIHTVPRHYYFCKKIIEKSKKIISISEYVKNEIIKSTDISEDKFVILYNSIDTEAFKPLETNVILETKKKYNIPINQKNVVFAGRLCKDKGIDKLLEAKEFSKTDYNIIIVGSNFYKTNIISDFEKLLIQKAKNISENIIFTGYINYSDMPRIYNCADVVVLPSMWDEPAGMTIIEGMACKKVVITTKSGGIPEYTAQGNCILLERDKNISKQIAKNIDKIFMNKELAKKISTKAYERASQFNTKYYYDTFVKIVLGDDKKYE